MKTCNIFPVILLSALVLTLSGCTKHIDPVRIPACITGIIRQKQAEPKTNPPATVEQWKVDGQTYYYITSDCCDQYNNLYDENCNYVCAPDGGLSGNGDHNCPDFTGPIEKTIVWTDKRQ